MKNIEQIYTSCLAQGSYFIESDGEAAVIDPLRESFPYLERAQEKGVKIKYIFETHFHADFVSGHLDLAKKTGATIVYGPKAVTDFDKHEAIDGEIFEIGKLRIKVLHTPGHTPESTSYLLIDEQEKQQAVFTGDTLFIGDVGRPDLAQKATNLTQEDLAGWLFDSLREKIMPLEDDVMVYPAHGAGSACGKNMSSETFDSLGNQKKTNYALRADMTKAEFIAEVTDGLMPPPQYFSKNGALISNLDQKIALVVNEDKAEEAVRRLARVGYDHTVGYLGGGIDAWIAAGETIEKINSIKVEDFISKEISGEEIVDVRKPGEHSTAHVVDACLMPLDYFLETDFESKLSKDKHYYIHCRSGFRSTVASSILYQKGFNKLTNVIGDFDQIKTSSFKVEGECPSLA